MKIYKYHLCSNKQAHSNLLSSVHNDDIISVTVMSIAVALMAHRTNKATHPVLRSSSTVAWVTPPSGQDIRDWFRNHLVWEHDSECFHTLLHNFFLRHFITLAEGRAADMVIRINPFFLSLQVSSGDYNSYVNLRLHFAYSSGYVGLFLRDGTFSLHALSNRIPHLSPDLKV